MITTEIKQAVKKQVFPIPKQYFDNESLILIEALS